MRAIVHDRYGSPEVLKLEETEKPEVTDDDVLVQVHAASVNRLDWYGVTGTPYVARVLGGLRRPKDPGLGVDFAGTVEAGRTSRTFDLVTRSSEVAPERSPSTCPSRTRSCRSRPT